MRVVFWDTPGVLVAYIRIVCLFGEGTHARSDVAEASGMAQKIVAGTWARSDNTALLGAAPLP